MPTNVDDIIAGLRPAKRRKVEARAAQLIAEETMQASKLTPGQIAVAMPDRTTDARSGNWAEDRPGSRPPRRRSTS